MGRRLRSRERERELLIISSSDDEEANKDLSLDLVAKSLSKRKTAQNNEIHRAFFIDLSVSSPEEELVTKKRKTRPKKKKKKKEVEDVVVTEQLDAPAKEKEPDGTSNSAIEVKQVIVTEPAGTSNSAVEVSNEATNNVVLRKLLRGPRYFDPGHGNWETCYNCGEEGHIAANCKEEKRQKPCFVCGMFGHIAKHCIQGMDCFVCKRRGHHAKECPDKHNKNNSEQSVICLRCGDLGHDMSFCRKDYASSDIKEIQCYICKKYGHLCCVDYKDNGPIEISCYNCAEFGHTGQGCAKQRFESTAVSVTPPTLCYRCGQQGHFARGCSKNLKSVKCLGESSMPVSRLKVMKVAKVSKSVPRDVGREHKKKSSYFDNSTRPVKSKVKGGWIVDDTGYLPKRRQTKDWDYATTPSGRSSKSYSASFRHGYSGSSDYSSYSSPHTPHQRYNCYAGTTPMSRGSTGSYHQGYSISRFGYSNGFYS